MLRVLGYFFVVGLIIAAGVWIADRPGSVTIVWMGREITGLTVGHLLVAVLLTGFIFSLVWRMWSWLRGAPRRFAEYRRDTAQRKGYLALTSGFQAIAAGDSEGARKQLRVAEAKLKDPSATLLLAAQTAELAGEANSAKSFYENMLDSKATKLAALKGLLAQARAEGDREGALLLARQAVQVKPNSAWATKALYELETRSRNWADAEKALTLAAKAGVFDSQEENARRSVLLTVQSREFTAQKRSSDASRTARKAYDLSPAFVPAVVTFAQTLVDGDRGKKAAQVIEDAWASAPHPDLARAYLAIGEASPIAKAQKAEVLAKRAPDHPESLFVIAETALDAQLWGRAREQLGRLTQKGVNQRASALMARLEQGENKDPSRAAEWLQRIPQSRPDPTWRCGECGAETKDWQPLCPECAGFDTLSWHTPSTEVALSPGWGYDSRKGK